MKNSILLLVSLAFLFTAQAQEQKPVSKNKPSEEIENLQLAYQLAKYGYKTFSSATLIEAAKIMSKNKAGRIVNFASLAVPLRLEGEAIYAASKAAIVSLTQVLAYELADFGITVNAVGPAPVKTDLVCHVPQEKMDRLIARQAVKRWGEMRDISNVVDFFIRSDSDFVTGQVIYLGGIS